MHYRGAVTSQSHTVYYIRFVRLGCCLCCAPPRSHYGEMIRAYSARLNVQICVIVFSFDKSQSPYSAGICVSSHLTLFCPRKERVSSRWLRASPLGLQSDISVCLFSFQSGSC